MVSNTDVTLLEAQEEGFRLVPARAFWRLAQRMKTSVSVVKEGKTASIYLPLTENPNLSGVALSTDWYILRGRGRGINGTTLTAKELLKLGGRRIVAADLFDYCSEDMRHWKLEVE